MAASEQPRIAVLLPCYNEEAAIAATIAGFREALPAATIYVYDNNSRDRTREVAAQAGAVVRTESQQGKGHVVRRMFADIDADIYVMADGDLTYDPKAAPAMSALPKPMRWAWENRSRSRLSTAKAWPSSTRRSSRTSTRLLMQMKREQRGRSTLPSSAGPMRASRRL